MFYKISNEIGISVKFDRVNGYMHQSGALAHAFTPYNIYVIDYFHNVLNIKWLYFNIE